MNISGKLDNELYRYVDPRHNGLVSVTDDGNTFILRPGQDDWVQRTRLKDGADLEEWISRKLEFKSKLKHWQLVDSIPSMSELEHWMIDGVAETTNGQEIEPDGIACDGSPSWLVALGLI